MRFLTLLLLLPLLFSSPPTFQEILHDLDHFKSAFQPQRLDNFLNVSTLVPSSSFLSPSSSFLPFPSTVPQNHHPTDQECERQENCGGKCDGICVPCLMNGELGWKCLKNMKIPTLEEP